MDFESIMQRYKDATRAASFAEVGRELGLSTSAYANRKRGGSIPFEALIPAARSHGINLSWLFFGDEEVLATQKDERQVTAQVDVSLLTAVAGELSFAMAENNALSWAIREPGKQASLTALIYSRVAALPANGERVQAIARDVRDFSGVAEIFSEGAELMERPSAAVNPEGA